ncbi:MAG: mandelate racemase/muconate lactonizing enzyme family protein [Gammaproteobacteria bacterium]|nr:mandelate racemase/muconate lactonizing enzyme family protein [Gammaproteobacteria bacterium]
MKIARISVYALALPLHHPYKLSGGRLRVTELDSTFVRIETEEGLVGWGEGCPWGHTYAPAHGEGIRAAAQILAPVLLGMDPRRLEHVNREMDIALPGHLYAKSPFDMACWDLLGKATEMPLVELLGGRFEPPPRIVSSVPTAAPDEMLAGIEDYRSRGYRAHSAKIGAHVDADVERIRHLLASRHEDELIVFDVNRAWTPMEAIQVMNAVRELPAVFEQPCETLDQCAAVRARTVQPISIDERLETLDDLRRIIDGRIAEIANIKVNRVGGLTRARRLRDLCLASGIRMLVMDTGGTVIADTAAVHLAESVPAEMCLGTWLCQELVTPDTAPGQGARNRQGRAQAPESPGLGVAPVEAELGEPVGVYC